MEYIGKRTLIFMLQILFTLILEELYTLTKAILLTSEKLQWKCHAKVQKCQCMTTITAAWSESLPFPSAPSFDLIIQLHTLCGSILM